MSEPATNYGKALNCLPLVASHSMFAPPGCVGNGTGAVGMRPGLY